MSKEIVQTCKFYDYNNFQKDIEHLKRFFPCIHIEIIGYSVLNKAIYAIRLGEGDQEVLYTGNWHANEYLTGHLLMKFIEDYARGVKYNRKINGYDLHYLFENYSIWIIPMINPDGIDLVINGLEESHPFYSSVLEINNCSLDFSNWTANFNGVDLNHQWPADWEKENERSPQAPSPKRYGGIAPLTEPETIAVYNFTIQHSFDTVLAFHSQGEEIFWGFNQYEPIMSESIVKRLSELTGYDPKKSASSSAGFKDWFVQEFRKPGFTIEVGLGENPLPIQQFKKIYQENLSLLLETPTLV